MSTSDIVLALEPYSSNGKPRNFKLNNFFLVMIVQIGIKKLHVPFQPLAVSLPTFVQT